MSATPSPVPRAAPSSIHATDLIVEAALLAKDVFADTSASASARGWTPLDLEGLTKGGVQTVDVGALAGLPSGAITSVAHVYEGNLDGKSTVVVAFRGTDEGADEFRFQASPAPPNPSGWRFGWDLYDALHRLLLDGVLGYAAGHGVERVLVTGHSLGGILAELAAERTVAGSSLENKTITVTFGSPGSAEVNPDGLTILNVLHSDDLITRLGEESPLLAFLAREGVDVLVDRPEASLVGVPPLDTVEALFQATQNPDYKIEHQIDLYVDTARALAENERVAPGVAGNDGPFRWLNSDVDRFILGNDTNECYAGGAGNQVLIGRGGDDHLWGGSGDDGLAGGAGDDRVFGGSGDDLLYASAGNDKLNGDLGVDTVVFAGRIGDYAGIAEGTRLVTSDDEAGIGEVTAHLKGVELLRFDDALFDVRNGALVPIGEMMAEPVGLYRFDFMMA